MALKPNSMHRFASAAVRIPLRAIGREVRSRSLAECSQLYQSRYVSTSYAAGPGFRGCGRPVPAPAARAGAVGGGLPPSHTPWSALSYWASVLVRESTVTKIAEAP